MLIDELVVLTSRERKRGRERERENCQRDAYSD
jgi:hypothetical protein